MALQSKHGGCHCGKVKFQVEIDLESPGLTCNCSICSKSGTILSFVPESSFTLLQGEDELTEYRFNKEAIAHLFCKRCGIRSFARGESPKGKMVAINLRCLDDVELDELAIKKVDGKSF